MEGRVDVDVLAAVLGDFGSGRGLGEGGCWKRGREGLCGKGVAVVEDVVDCLGGLAVEVGVTMGFHDERIGIIMIIYCCLNYCRL